MPPPSTEPHRPPAASRSARPAAPPTWRAGTPPRPSASPAPTPSPAAPTRTCTAGACGPCASTPASAPRRATNARFRALLAAGQTGLSVAFDLPTQLGLDSDDPRAAGEVGRVGVAIDTTDDLASLFAGIPLAEVSTSMTINATAAVLLLMYRLVAEEQGADPRRLRGTVQNDILKEYSARGTYIYPPRPSLRLVTDLMAYCAAEMPGVEHHLGQRVPPAGGGGHRRPGGGLHPGQRPGLRGRGASGGPAPGGLRPAALLLLERPQPPVRGGGQVPRLPGGCGPACCTSAPAPRTRSACACASTRRRRAAP